MTKTAAAPWYPVAMKILYADSLFALSLLTDYLLCLSAGRVCGLTLRRGRYLAAAALGAVYAVAVFLPGLGWLALPVMQLVAAGLMGLVAFGGEERLLRCLAVLLALSATFGGMVWAVFLRSPGGPRLSLLLGVFAACYGALTLLSRTRRRRADARLTGAVLTLAGKTVSFPVLLDTGNCLTDPVTGARVLVAAPEALAPLLPERAELFALSDPVELAARLGALPETRGRARLLACATVGGPGLLAALRPDTARVDGKPRPGLLAAVSPAARGEGFEGVY